MTGIQIRGYRGTDEEALLDLWGDSLPFDPIDAPTFRLKVLLDPNFHPDWLLVAEKEGRLAGFCLCLIRRVAMDKGGLDPESGWITALGVHPEQRRQGVGAALIDRAVELFRGAGRKQVSLSPYTPNYFVPGVDMSHYAEGLAFLEKRGFAITSRPISMDANIVLLDPRPYQERERILATQGTQIQALQPHQLPDLMAFLQEHMPGDWVRHGRELLAQISRGQGTWAQFTLAWHQDQVVGYCQFEGEHFGPFGVREGLQGQGIGTALLARCLRAMQEQGHHHAWVLWTSDENADKVYGRFGFKETRRFAVLRRLL